MIKVALQCHSCDVQICEEINVKTGPPRWAANLWNKAVKAGWARDEDKHVAYCPSCPYRAGITFDEATSHSTSKCSHTY